MKREAFDALGSVFALFMAFCAAGVAVAWAITWVVEFVARTVFGGH